LYATYVHAPKDAQAEGCQVGVMVIDPGNGQVDTIPLFGFVKKSDADAALALTLQLGVSPDGSMVAVSPGYVEPAMVKPADRALYVVDVKSPRHKVRKLPLPAPPKE
jgi:hypothetical protein